MDGTGQTRKKLEKLEIEAWARLAWLTKNINPSEVFQLFVYAALEIKLLFFCSGESAKEKPTVGRSRTWVRENGTIPCWWTGGLPKRSWLSANFPPEHYPASLRRAFRPED